MKNQADAKRLVQTAICIVWIASSAAGATWSEWRHSQEFFLSTPGLVKISLPVETLDAARPGLEDLRIQDNAGNELPFLVTRPAPPGRAPQAAKSFQISLQSNRTVITLETGLSQPES